MGKLTTIKSGMLETQNARVKVPLRLLLQILLFPFAIYYAATHMRSFTATAKYILLKSHCDVAWVVAASIIS